MDGILSLTFPQRGNWFIPFFRYTDEVVSSAVLDLRALQVLVEVLLLPFENFTYVRQEAPVHIPVHLDLRHEVCVT